MERKWDQAREQRAGQGPVLAWMTLVGVDDRPDEGSWQLNTTIRATQDLFVANTGSSSEQTPRSRHDSIIASKYLPLGMGPANRTILLKTSISQYQHSPCIAWF